MLCSAICDRPDIHSSFNSIQFINVAPIHNTCYGNPCLSSSHKDKAEFLIGQSCTEVSLGLSLTMCGLKTEIHIGKHTASFFFHLTIMHHVALVLLIKSL